jgi:hypothetical protein
LRGGAENFDSIGAWAEGTVDVLEGARVIAEYDNREFALIEKT